MPRRLRQFEPGAVTHLTTHGVADQPIFRSDLDRFALLALLRRLTARVDWQILAWCFLDTHYHLLVVAAREPRISWAMQVLNSVYAREFNRRHGRRGHVFGERFTDTAVLTDAHLDAAISYIFRNPVDAGLVARLEDWAWSGDGRLEPRRVRQRNLKVTTRPATSASASATKAVLATPPRLTPTPSSTPATR